MVRYMQLDGMRGVFSLILVFFHFPFHDSILTDNFFIRSGDLFVDFFFVLSGFVITHTYKDKIGNFIDVKRFLLRRLKRLYPLLLFSVALFALMELIGIFLIEGIKNNIKTPFDIFLLSIDSLTFSNSIFWISNSEGMNYPSWSISAEMIAYIVFALVCLFFGKSKNIVLASILLLAIFFVFYKQRFMFTSDFGFVRGLIGFISGYFTYNIQNIFQHKDTSNFEFLGLFALLILFYCTNFSDYQPYKLLFPLFFSINIFIFANSKGVLSKFLKYNKIIQYLGAISYSIYLNHALILIITNVFFFRLLHKNTVEPYITISLLLSFIITILYSILTYNYIEKKYSLSQIKK